MFSIGSLGDRNSEAHVSGVLVDGGNLFDTTNGLRIKTWQVGTSSNIHAYVCMYEGNSLKLKLRIR